uniref:Arrestin C-terminal-like domain-containing protein n=1 Tax=Panagrolaimus superbus TaxID=310955 RepID=A0A914XUX7_9BILA
MEGLQISLNSTTNIFFANSEVNGTVYLKIEEPLKARKIDVSIIGRAKTSFHHQRGKHTYLYSSIQSYLQQEFVLWKCQNGSNKLLPGSHQFPFKFMIPLKAPPNISGQYGNIRYYIKANIDIPWTFNKFVILAFSVYPYIDLNIDIRLAAPAIKYMEKAGIFSSKAVKVTLRMPKRGYVCGESIPIHVSIENESTSEIKSVESGIRATYIFTATENTIFNGQTMAKDIIKKYCVEDVPLPNGMTKNTVFTRDIEIPQIPPSFDHCEIIRLQYYVFVKVHTSAIFSCGPIASMPIIIGTIPLRKMISSTFGKPNPPAPTAPPPDYDFNDANFGDRKNRKERRRNF